MTPNLLSEKDIATIRGKLSLDHRTEDDWIVVKDLLREHDVVVMEPMEKNSKYKTYDHILFDHGGLLTFTSILECQRYINQLTAINGRIMFTIGAMPFLDATRISDKHHKSLYIDFKLGTPFIRYRTQQIAASIVMPTVK